MLALKSSSAFFISSGVRSLVWVAIAHF